MKEDTLDLFVLHQSKKKLIEGDVVYIEIDFEMYRVQFIQNMWRQLTLKEKKLYPWDIL